MSKLEQGDNDARQGRRYLRVRDIVGEYRISRARLYALVKAKKLPAAEKLGRSSYWDSRKFQAAFAHLLQRGSL